MNRTTVFLGGTILAAGLAFGVGAHAHEGHSESKEGKPVTVQGELVDTACFTTSDGDEKGKDHAACARKCLASGIPAGILPQGAPATPPDSDSVLFLLVNPKPLAPYAAQTIKVEGTQYDDKHAIDVTHIYVKDGDGWKEINLSDEHHAATQPGAGK